MKKLIIILLFSITSLFAFENLTASNFDSKVNNKNALVEFYTTWWPSCHALGQSLTQYNASKTDDVTIYKVDLEQEPELAKRFNIRGFPILLYLKNGEVVAQEFGVKTPAQLTSSIQKHFK